MGTSAAYVPKQRNFADFCLHKQYHGADIVTEDKLLLFLVEEVADRQLRAEPQGCRIPRAATWLAWRSLPREDDVQRFVKYLQQQDVQQHKINHVDKSRRHFDNYSESEFERICYELWAHSYAAPEWHLRTLVDLLLGDYMLYRGGERHKISDLFSFEFEEGPTRCMPLIFTMWAEYGLSRMNLSST